MRILSIVFLLFSFGVSQLIAAPPWSSVNGSSYESSFESSSFESSHNSSFDSGSSWDSETYSPTGNLNNNTSGPPSSTPGCGIVFWCDDDGELDGQSEEPHDVPVDGGLGLLLMAGMGYGAHRMRRNKNEEDDE